MKTYWHCEIQTNGTHKKIPVLHCSKQEAARSYLGFCLECGSVVYGYSPKSLGALCEECGAEEIVGTAHGVAMNRIRLEENEGASK